MRTPAQIIRDYRKGKKGFTLVEVIIASSLFSVVSLIGVGVFINITRIQKRIYLENAIYEDGRFLMERLSREIRLNTIDYEEYYNKLVEGKDYGAEHGCYASRFYNPGRSSGGGVGGGTAGPGSHESGLGAFCNGGLEPKIDPGCTIDKKTLDINTGQNPYTGKDSNPGADTANAMCDSNFGGGHCTSTTLNDSPELYLINPSGTEKTLFALKTVNKTPSESEFALSMIRLDGADVDGDGIVEKWLDTGLNNFYCAPLYNCTYNDPDFKTLEASLDGTKTGMLYKGFVPISPLRTTVTKLHFYIAPLEDPRKAFAETDPALAIQQQPHVTIVMTLTPAASELTGYAETPPSVTLQNTVSSRVYNEVKSYTGDGVCTKGY